MNNPVVVEREEIEAVRNTLANGGPAVSVLRWAETILAAQPAEAEGVVAWAPSTALEMLKAGFNNSPCVLTDGPAEFNNVPLVRLYALSAVTAERDRLREFERICEGLPQDAIDGGWTALGISKHAKALEAELDRLREANASRSDKLNEAQSIIEQARAEADLPYVSAIGDAGEAYMQNFPYAHPLPASFRWQELWEVMHRAALAAKEA